MRKSLFILGLLLSLSVSMWGQTYTANGYVTYTIANAQKKIQIESSSEGDETCNSLQGMAVGADFCYVAKIGSKNVYADIARVDMKNWTSKDMCYVPSMKNYDKYSEIDCNSMGHANGMEIVEGVGVNSDETWLFVATMKENSLAPITRMKVIPNVYKSKEQPDNDYKILTDYYDTQLDEKSQSISAIKYVKTIDDKLCFILKSGRAFYTAQIPLATTSTSTTATGSVKTTTIPIYKFFEMDVRNAVFATSNSDASTQDGLHGWTNQSFGYNPLQNVIYVPIWNGSTSAGKKTSAILTYNMDGYITDDLWTNPSHKDYYLFPTKTAFMMTHASDALFEIEATSFRTGTTDKLYFNTNCNTPANEGVYEVTLGTTDFTPVNEGKVTYTIKYDANGGTGTMADSRHIQGISSRISKNTFTNTNKILTYTLKGDNQTPTTLKASYDFGGWHIYRHSDSKWLYTEENGTVGWHRKGEQPIGAILTVRGDEYKFTNHPTNVDGDVVTLYAFWKPKADGTEDTKGTFYYVRYDGNGGTDSKGKTMTGDTPIEYNVGARIMSPPPFARTGYKCIGWNVFRYHAGQTRKDITGQTVNAENQWGYIRCNDDGSNHTGKESYDYWMNYAEYPTYTAELQSTDDESVHQNHRYCILKTYSTTATATTTSSVDADLLIFYAQWARIVGGTYPSILKQGEAFTIEGKLQCTTDMYAVSVRVKQGNTLVSGFEYRKYLYTSPTTQQNPGVYTEGFDLSDANSVLDFSTLATGDYTYEVAVEVISNVKSRSEVLYSSAFRVSEEPIQSEVLVPTENGTVELANPTYSTRATGKYTGSDDAHHKFSTYQNNWYDFTDPVRVGYTFAGWESNYVTSNQYMEDIQGNALPLGVYATNKPIQLGTNADGVYHIGKLGGADDETGKDISEFTDQLTVNVWAHMDDWSNFHDGTAESGKDIPTKKIISCTHSTAGWNIGEANPEGKFKWKVATTNETSSWKVATDDRTYADLAPGWHMFTITWNSELVNAHQYEYTCYVDGVKFTNPSNERYKSVQDINYLKQNGQTILTLGAEPGTDGEITGSYFGGQIRNLSIMNVWMYDFVQTGQLNTYATWLKTPVAETYTLKPHWIENTKTVLNIKHDTDFTELIDNNSTSAETLGGTKESISFPAMQNDYFFKHWGGNNSDLTFRGSDYISNYQGIEYLKAGGSEEADIFTHSATEQTSNGIKIRETNPVLFNADNSHYFVADNSYKHSDAFTVNVWAKMDDWTNFSVGDGDGMRLFSCWSEQIYGFSIIPSATSISFVGADLGEKEAKWQKATANITWSDLNNEDKWHMFTYVFDGNYIRGYINGVCVAISERFERATLRHHPTNHIVLGAEATNDAYGVAPRTKFVGEMKNFAVMHTALAPSQVQDLYANPGISNYYYASDNAKTLAAVWEKLSPLEAEDVEIHALAGDEEASKTIDVQGNGKSTTTLTLEDSQNASQNVSLKLLIDNDGKWSVTYKSDKYYVKEEDKAKNYLKTALTIADAEGWSTPKTYNVEAYIHRFDIAYWNREGFAVQLDEKDADFLDCEITITPKDKSALKLSGKISGTKRTDNTYFIPLSNETINTGLDLSQLSDQEVAIHIEQKDANGNVDWTIDSKRWVPKYITSADGFTSIENPARDVVIAGDVVLNADLTTTDATTGKPNKLGDVYVQPDASFTLSEGGALEADALVIYSEGDQSPSVSIPEGSTFNIKHDNPTIYYSKRVKANRWYFFSLPYRCKASEIHFADGSGENYTEIYIQEFDGLTRATKKTTINTWKWVKNIDDDGNDIYLEAGTGYVLAIDKKRCPNGADVVFPMHIAKAEGAEALELHSVDNASKTLTLESHATERVKPANATAHHGYFGWNLIGAPYLSKYGFNTLEDIPNMKQGSIYSVEYGDNIYLTVPDQANNTYHQYVYNDKEHPINPFSAFYVQMGGDNDYSTLEFKLGGKKSIVARRQSAADKPSSTFVGVTLSNDTYTDKTALVVGNQFTQAYEIGSDLEKMLGTGAYPQVYVTDASNKYAFKSLSVADAAGTNKLGVYLPTNGEYTFAVNESFDLSGIQTVHLTDYQEGVTVNLLNSPYTFTSGAVHTTSRFALSAVLSADVATDLSSGTAIAWAVWQDAPLHVQVQGVTAGDQIRVYDSMGHLILQTVATDTTVAFALPAEGAYCIQTVGTQGSQVKKMMVK